MRQPPRKLPGQAATPRRFNGALLDINAAAQYLGTTTKTIRARVARRLLPFRKNGGRILFVRSELDEFLRTLPGCSVQEAIENIEMRAER